MRKLRDVVRSAVERGRMVLDGLTARVVGGRSYAQCGEDLILRFAFNSVGIYRPRYLDVGAHDPLILSNTALFYKGGSRGVNVEPNVSLYGSFLRFRRRDVNLNIGIGDQEGVLDFYVMGNPELSTFSKETAEEYRDKKGEQIREVRPVPVRRIDDVMREHFPDRPPDLLCVDAEGLDLTILRSIDFARAAPLAICVETIDFVTGGKGQDEIHKLLDDQGYFVYADTWINTIFFHTERYYELRGRMTGKPDAGLQS